MTITINRELSDSDGEGYSLNASFSISDEATAEQAVTAFAEALSIEGYTDYSIIDALVKVASEVAYNKNLEQALKDSITSVQEEWEWNKSEEIND